MKRRSCWSSGRTLDWKPILRGFPGPCQRFVTKICDLGKLPNSLYASIDLHPVLVNGYLVGYASLVC